jgi:uncharacterized Ntn-hydrolase superfamily protein
MRNDRHQPIVATYSIIARDRATGQMGVAVQSCYFGVGTIVPWAEAGVGVVATQAFANADFGPEGLRLLRTGLAAADALARLLERDPDPERRQVAILDARGGVAAHTGRRCIDAAGDLTGDGVSTQANMMADRTVWPAMLDAYERAGGDLAARLLTALEAAEAAGGDIRGRQSAALLVVGGRSSDAPWRDRLFDLRVDDHPSPVAELGRLLRLRRAQHAHAGFLDAVTTGRTDEAVRLLEEALRLAPDLDEVRLSGAVAAYMQGQREEARSALHGIFARKPGLAEWVVRMAAAGMLPADAGLLELVSAARS